MLEAFFTCPHCFSRVSVLVDPSIGKQHYIEDCERCCNPLEFHIAVNSGEVSSLDVNPAQ